MVSTHRRIPEFHGKTGLAKHLLLWKKKPKLAGLQGNETSPANAAVSFTPDGKLWALSECGPPFRFRMDSKGVPESLGFDNLNATFDETMCAHPKFDQGTGETFFHGRQLTKSFFVGRIADGELKERLDLHEIVGDGFHHDAMFITENFVVVVDGSCRLDVAGAVQKMPLWKQNQDEKLRFGIFDRRGVMTAEAFIWIEADFAAEIVHTLYAYDDGAGEICLWAPMSFYTKNADDMRLPRVLGDMGSSVMHRIIINVKQETVSVAPVGGGQKFNTKFPRIRDDRVGLRTRYGYSAIQAEDEEFNFTGYLKWDFEKANLAASLYFSTSPLVSSVGSLSSSRLARKTTATWASSSGIHPRKSPPLPSTTRRPSSRRLWWSSPFLGVFR